MRRQLHKFVQLLWKQEEGTSATEYAIMITLILVFCIAAVLSTGDIQKAMWLDNADTITSKIGSN